MGPRANDVVAPPARRELSANGSVLFNAILQAGLSHDRAVNQLSAVARHDGWHHSLSLCHRCHHPHRLDVVGNRNGLPAVGGLPVARHRRFDSGTYLRLARKKCSGMQSFHKGGIPCVGLC